MNGNRGQNIIRTQKSWARVTEPRDSPRREAVLGQKPKGHHSETKKPEKLGKTRKVQRHRMLHKGGRKGGREK